MSALKPEVDSTHDLGTTALRWRDLYVDGITVTDNISIGGNLTVNGTTTTVSSQNLVVEDPLFKLGEGNDGDAKDIGFFGQYNNAGTDTFAGLFRDASDGKFKLFTGSTETIGNTIDTGNAGYSAATLVVGTLTSGTLDITGNGSIDGNFDVNGNKFTVVAASGNTSVGGTLGVTGAATLSSTLGVTGNLSVNTDKFVVVAASGNTSVAGTLDVDGDTSLDVVSISETLGVTGATTLSSTLGVTGATTLSSTLSAGASTLTSASITNNATVGGTLGVTGASTLASASVTGNATVGGTLGVTGDVAINTNKFNITAASGNTAIAGTLDVTGDTTITGNLTVNGTTTTVNSTTVTIDDPIFTLGGDTAPGSDDNKDRGIEFRYYDGSAKLGFMGWDDSAEKFTLLTNATNTNEVFSGTAADLAIGELTSTGSTIDGIRIGVDSATTIDVANDAVSDDLILKGKGNDERVQVAGAFNVTGAADLDSTLDVAGLASLDGGIDVDGAFTVADTSGNVSTSGTLGVTGATSLSTLSTSGAATLASASVTNNATVGGTLTVTGGTTLSSTLDVTDLASLDGGIDVDGAFTVADTSGNVSTSGTLSVTGDVAINTNKFNITAASGNTAIAGTLSVTGESTLASATVSDLTSGRVVLAGTDGAIEDNGNLTFNGSALGVTGTAAISSNATVGGTLGVTGAATLSSTLGVTGNISVATDKFTVTAASGNTSVAGTLVVGGAATFGSSLSAGAATLSSLSISGLISSSGGDLTISDPLILISSGGNVNKDIGIYAERGSGSDDDFLGLIYDQSESRFRLWENMKTPNIATSTFLFGAAGDNADSAPANLELGQIYLNDYEQLAANQGDGDSISTSTHATLVTTGGDTTLDNVDLGAGTEGQIKVIIMEADGTDNLRVDVAAAGWAGGAGTITLTDRGHACTLQYINSNWWCIGNNGCTFA